MQIENTQEPLLLVSAADSIAQFVRDRGYVAQVQRVGNIGQRVVVSRAGLPDNGPLPTFSEVEIKPASRRYIHSGYVKDASIQVPAHWRLRQKPLRMTKFTSANYFKAAKKAVEFLLLAEEREKKDNAHATLKHDNAKREAALVSWLTGEKQIRIPSGFFFAHNAAAPDTFFAVIGSSSGHELVGPWSRDEALDLCRSVHSIAATRRGHDFRPGVGEALLAQRESTDAKPV